MNSSREAVGGCHGLRTGACDVSPLAALPPDRLQQLHLAAQLLGDAAIVGIVLRHPRRNEHEQLGAVAGEELGLE